MIPNILLNVNPHFYNFLHIFENRDIMRVEGNNMSIGKRIKEKREEYGMFQEDLAKRLNVTSAAISSWERDRTEPNMGMVNKLCNVLNCDVEWLVYGTAPSEKLAIEEQFFLEAYRRANTAARLAAYNELMKGVKNAD